MNGAGDPGWGAAALRELLKPLSRAGGLLKLASLRSYPARAWNERRMRRRAMAVRVAEDVAVCRVLGRYKMFVQASDHGHAVHLMLDGFWEMAVTQVVAGLVRPGMAAVDVGANQGYYTLLLAGLVGPEGAVHAVEPNPQMMGLLRRSVAANGLGAIVRCHERALGAEDGRPMVLRIPDGMPSGAWTEPAEAERDGSIRTTTLDALLGDAAVDFIKIDAEGAELPAWAGMAGIRARRAPLIVLMEFVLDRAPGAAAFFAEVAREGFTLSYVDQARGLRPVAAADVLGAVATREWMLVLRR